MGIVVLEFCAQAEYPKIVKLLIEQVHRNLKVIHT